ncbi:hypothetical protein NDU88_005180 [Pleurodeles waltl]|uniref:Uncharacterized protein n=1 Tax=Pleurodeles waltl TaxID=8319 RepID=A0AAV7T9Y7_PLEWA|nr:hypothetical protein NDU88_005180 [Pleurodeles waltl]
MKFLHSPAYLPLALCRGLTDIRPYIKSVALAGEGTTFECDAQNVLSFLKEEHGSRTEDEGRLMPGALSAMPVAAAVVGIPHWEKATCDRQCGRMALAQVPLGSASASLEELTQANSTTATA